MIIARAACVKMRGSMRAIQIEKPGGPEALRPAERTRPEPKPHEILVKVAAAGVNRPDVLQRMGLYAVPPDASDLPGLEIAGEVVDCGSAVKMWKAGDLVCALTHGGGYAEYCVTPEVQALPVPKGLSLVEAASLPETFFTVWSNVYDRGRLAPGETLLVQGGTSGIGVTAIQMAKATGNRVFATAGSDEKCAACVKLGADAAFNYKTQDFVAGVKAATGGKGVDVILDMAAGDFVPKELKALADDGRLVFIAFLRGAKTELDVNELMRRRLTLTGSTLRPRDAAYKGRLAEALVREVWPLLATGEIRIDICATFPFERMQDAHRVLDENRQIGKVVVLGPES